MSDSIVDQYRRDLDYIHNIFDRLRIKWHYYDLPEKDQFDNFVLKPIEEECVLFISYDNEIFKLHDYMLEDWLHKFFNYNSQLIIVNPMGIESSNWLYKFLVKNEKKYLEVFKKFSDKIVFLHCDTIEPQFIKKFKELKFFQTHASINIFKLPNFMRNNYRVLPKTDKFLITTIMHNRKHRCILNQEFKNHNVTNYIGKFHDTREDATNSWLGDQSCPHRWLDGEIAWDMYDRASFEVVPETHFEFVTHITEKTYKPMIAKIPFLVLSNPRFYIDLKNHGFKTFDSLIDESFAYKENLEERILGLIETIKDIQNNNAIDFYHSAKEICEHNFDHCYYLAGKEKHNHYINSIALDKYIKGFDFNEII